MASDEMIYEVAMECIHDLVVAVAVATATDWSPTEANVRKEMARLMAAHGRSDGAINQTGLLNIVREVLVGGVARVEELKANRRVRGLNQPESNPENN